MSKIEVYKCDGCGKLLEDRVDIYKLDLKTDEFWTGPGNDYGQCEENLCFCVKCARNIKNTLEKIANK